LVGFGFGLTGSGVGYRIKVKNATTTRSNGIAQLSVLLFAFGVGCFFVLSLADSLVSNFSSSFGSFSVSVLMVFTYHHVKVGGCA